VARIFMEDLDARDSLAFDVFLTFIKAGRPTVELTAYQAYDAAEAFLDVRNRKLGELDDDDYDRDR
jgi:hypothetical protein